ncbi:MAG TPA: Panacea domain-containing protein [Jatrophihabitans sp.]|jgi:uncharacterized phage-associated protein|uniref:Panacea domain-containing protein n=1 Tax=Jatrophihabitans sp. TaxID=1932789 RepID=UPI002EE8366F
MAAYSAYDVATEIRTRLPGVPVKKLHKLLYYCQAHHVATFNHPLFGETISAWDMGPVVGELWRREKEGDTQEMPPVRCLTEAELNTIGYVLSRYGNLSGTDLERLTHSEAPWIDADAARRRLGQSSHRITLDALRAFFCLEADQSEPGMSDESSGPPIDPAELEIWFQSASDGPPAAVPVADSPEALAARMG